MVWHWIFCNEAFTKNGFGCGLLRFLTGENLIESAAGRAATLEYDSPFSQLELSRMPWHSQRNGESERQNRSEPQPSEVISSGLPACRQDKTSHPGQINGLFVNDKSHKTKPNIFKSFTWKDTDAPLTTWPPPQVLGEGSTRQGISIAFVGCMIFSSGSVSFMVIYFPKNCSQLL